MAASIAKIAIARFHLRVDARRVDANVDPIEHRATAHDQELARERVEAPVDAPDDKMLGTERANVCAGSSL